MQMPKSLADDVSVVASHGWRSGVRICFSLTVSVLFLKNSLRFFSQPDGKKKKNWVGT